ncbi:hypothetical protein ACNKHW_14485 [Shigella flexneri]
MPQAANYRAAPLCNGDPDNLILELADMPGEKVAKVRSGMYEAVRNGMVVNLCWRQFRSAVCVLTRITA